MGSLEQAVMGLASQAVSAQIAKHFVTILNKACNKLVYILLFPVYVLPSWRYSFTS